MSEIPTAKRTTKGVFLRGFTVGDPIGRSLAEWAYRTPRYPSGLTTSALKEAGGAIQRETVLFWFLLNLRPYDLSGGQWFAFDSPGRGFGQAPFAPGPLRAIDIVNNQFGDVVDTALLQELSSTLAGDWMWDGVPYALESDTLSNASDMRRSILEHLALLRAAIDNLSPRHGEMGHNLQFADETLTTQERHALLDAVERTSAGVTSSDIACLATVRDVWSSLTPITERLANWLLARLDDFGTEFSKAAGRSLGEKLPVYALRILAAAGAWYEIQIVAERLFHLPQ